MDLETRRSHPTYRLYRLGRKKRGGAPPVVLHFPSETEAVRYVRSILDETSLELWLGRRLVVRLDPERDEAPPRPGFAADAPPGPK